MRLVHYVTFQVQKLGVNFATKLATCTFRCLNYCKQMFCLQEEIRDLLAKDQKKRLELKERPDTGIYVKVNRRIFATK